MVNTWDLMESGRTFLRELQFEAAAVQFSKAMTAEPKRDDSYQFFGASQWLLGKPQEAQKVWIKALTCSYQDMAMLESPLLLYLLSVIYPDCHSRAEAVALIEKRLLSRRANAWPGPACRYLLGKISESEMREAATHERGKVREYADCAMTFGLGIHCYEQGDFEGVRSAWHECANCNRPQTSWWHIVCFELRKMNNS
jgi:hypothetical protein